MKSIIIIEIATLFIFIITAPVIVLTERIMSINVKDDKSALELMKLGDQLYVNGRSKFNDASVLYWEAIKQDPKLLNARLRLAEIYYTYIWNYEALNQLKEIEKIDPKYPGVYFLMGKIYHRLNDNNKALELFQKAIALQPENPSAYYYLGTIYQQQNNEEKALTSYYNAVKFLDKDKESVVKSFLQIGRIYKNRNDLINAKEVFKSGLRLDPNSTEIILELKNLYEQEANIFKSQQRFDKAVAAYEEIVKLEPDKPENSWIYVEIGNIYRNMELNDKAISAYRKAAKIDPLNYDAFSALKELKQKPN